MKTWLTFWKDEKDTGPGEFKLNKDNFEEWGALLLHEARAQAEQAALRATGNTTLPEPTPPKEVKEETREDLTDFFFGKRD